MGVGKFIQDKGKHIDGFREELSRLSEQSGELFFRFFDNSGNEQEAFVTGAWDFSIHIALPLCGHVSKPLEKTALEVGYGGGRLLAAGANHFGAIHGIDIHGQTDLVGQALRSRGINNAVLHRSDGRNYPLPDASIDVAYSFIVFQHLELIGVAEDNMREIARVLKPGGLALLYFGRVGSLSLRKSSNLLRALDYLYELSPFAPAVVERKARVNETNLLISLAHFRSLCQRAGLRLLSSGLSRRRVPDDGHLMGGQRYVLARKA